MLTLHQAFPSKLLLLYLSRSLYTDVYREELLRKPDWLDS